ncbi:peptide deformylase [Clostridium sp. C8-1-8]|uniref:peptide deformylase n=1 Tax=Clostridium sp. C8-1-8 TaxID=2698831 RepID=UPI00136BA3B1|nr:peptide deformylase [Clostridium sp. C8-1-8]
MALRNIRTIGDEILRKRCREVDVINDRIKTLANDMIETMYSEDGVGLAAPQVGILKRIFVVDVYDDYGPRVFINPEILETEGEQIDMEGCLSIPGEQSEVTRPNKVKVKALNLEGKEFVLEAEGLLARAICHENDHLNGVLFVDYSKQ